MTTRIACDIFAALHCVLEAFEVQTRWLFRRAASDLKPPGNAVMDRNSGSCRIRKVHGLGESSLLILLPSTGVTPHDLPQPFSD